MSDTRPLRANEAARHGTAVLALFTLVAVFISCGRGTKDPGADALSDGNAAGKILPLSAVSGDVNAGKLKAVVSFVEGKPFLLRDGLKTGLSAGDMVAGGDVVETDASSSVELTVAAGSRIVVARSSTLEISSLRGKGERINAGWKIVSGSVYFKVQKLVAADSFTIRTPSAHCGVRGTEFSVRVIDESRGFLVVREGRVSVLPASRTLDAIIGERNQNAVATAFLSRLEAVAPVTEAGQGMDLVSADAGAEAALAGVAGLFHAAGASGKTAIGKEVDKTLAESARSVANSLPPARIAGDDELLSIQAMFKPGREMDLPLAPDPAPASSAGSAPKNGSAPAISPESTAAIMFRTRQSGGAVSQALVQASGMILGIDGKGLLSARDASGNLAWTLDTGSAPLTGGHPVSYRENVYVARPDGVIGISSKDGKIFARSPAFKPLARPAQHPDGLVVATAEGLTLLDAATLSALSSIIVQGGLAGGVATWRNIAYAMKKDGTIVAVDPAREEIAWSAATGVENPYPPRLYQDMVCFSGSNGKLVLVSAKDRLVLRSIDVGMGAGAESEFGAEGVFVFGNGKVKAYDLEGNPLGEISGLRAPPLLARGKLHALTGGKRLVIYDAATLSQVSRLRLPAESVTRPLMVDGLLWVALDDGSLARVDPAKMGK